MTEGRPVPSAPVPVRLVVFDLGGVLVRLARSWTEACQVAGVPVREGADGALAVAIRRPWFVEHETGRLACEEFFAGVSTAMGGLYSPEEVERVHHAWLLGEFPGVLDLVDALHDAGVETAVLSNTNATHWGERGRFPAWSFVRRPFASHLLGVRKPDPSIYARLEAETGRRGAEIVFFDDLAANVEGARASGWRAERVDPQGDPAAEMRAHLRRMGVPI